MEKHGIFDVMKKSDAYPRMKFPSAVVLALAVVLIAGFAEGFLCSSARTELSAVGAVAGLVFYVPMFALAAALYSSLIVRARSAFTLTVSIPAFAASIIFGADLVFAVVSTAALLVSSYVLSSCMLRADITRFKRVSAAAILIALSSAAAIFVLSVVHFGSLNELIADFMKNMPAFLSDVYSSMLAGTGFALSTEDVTSAAREILMAMPAYIGMWSYLMAWMCDSLARRSAIRAGAIARENSRIIPTREYAAVYLVSLVLSILLPSSSAPVISMAMTALVYIMIVPCAYAGGVLFIEWLSSRFTRARNVSRAAAALIILMLFMGFMPAAIILSVIGGIGVLKKRMA